jgi:hypothetical protein
LIYFILSLFPSNQAVSQEVFDHWKVFPGPNPQEYDFLPFEQAERSFCLGHLVFTLPDYEHIKGVVPPSSLRELPSVAQLVEASKPLKYEVDLVSQQLSTELDFEFSEATLHANSGNGYYWTMVHHVSFTSPGGRTGPPIIYKSLLDWQGHRIRPQIAIFDLFCHSVDEGWTFSMLPISVDQNSPKEKLSEHDVVRLAKDRLASHFIEAKKPQLHGVFERLKFVDLKKVEIPVEVDVNDKVVCREIWAVNFVDDAKLERPGEKQYLTLWVSLDGKVAEIQSLDFIP